MRDWHHEIIKLDEALTALSTNNNKVVIGVFESQIEFENLSTSLEGLNYRAKNRGLFKITDHVQKSSLIGLDATNKNITPNILISDSSSHTTSVAGIILGNEYDSNGNILPIRGIIEDAKLINIPNRVNNLLFSTVDNFNYFMNKGGAIINPNFVFYEAPYVYNNNPYIPKNKQAKIINASVSLAINTPSAIATFDVLFKTWKAYANDGRGVLFIAAAGNSGNDTALTQDFGKFKDPLIISAVTIDNDQILANTKELKASYSCYGDRIDMCGPSNGMKHGIYTTTNLKCGEIGYHDEVITKKITNQSSNGNLTLNNVHLIFPGNCVEIGVQDSFNHEVLIVKDVDRSSNKITFVNDRYYTAKPFPINPATVRIPILKTNATITSSNTFSVIDNKGLGYKGQEICIFNGTVHHYTTIDIVRSPNLFTFTSPLPVNYDYTTTNIEIIPGQAICTATSYNISGENTDFTFSPSDNNILSSFFVGETVAVYDITNSITNPDFLSVANIDKINLTGTRTITLGKYNLKQNNTPTTIQLRSVGYGSYTSSFGGTSAATPVVSGVAGLIAKANPNLNSIEIKHILKSTSDKISLTETDSNGRWKDENGNNIRYSSASSLSRPTAIGDTEIFVNNLSLYNKNDLIKIDGDFTSAIEEIKNDHLVLQFPVKKVYNSNKNVEKCSTFPFHSNFYGVGRVNAKRAVQLALDWNNTQKPKLEIADKLEADTSGTLQITQVPNDVDVMSPDIWVKPLSDSSGSLPTETQIFNTIDTAVEQKIHIKIRNTGDKDSFTGCELRVFVAFTNDATQAFPFPNSWYDQEFVKLLSVKEIPIITAGGYATIEIEWTSIASFWDKYNPLPSVDGVLTPGGRRKNAYILAHIAPFDGLFEIDNSDPEAPRNLSLLNIRNNKQLSCKKLIVTHNLMSDRSAYIPGKKLNITVGTDIIEKYFDLSMENTLASGVDTLQIKATRRNRQDQATEEVIFQKTGIDWALTNSSTDWIEFQTPRETASSDEGYKNVIFPHKLTINEDEDEIKLEIININA
ncbi:S8 family serine peptidase [Flavobacterium sp. LS1R47]|uniref:S8 family serine peptidase n=1 Tax=Flavobacterium frigoritolerans TaxID=2987686 RepID=A0A9X2ZHZ8_9FLAO|nr:S8 family serine peptidase [Flavobacterium frigoritolerans]MCV9931741.1 S8 family serine peptidase [Flavobacterium frigoritolerans]